MNPFKAYAQTVDQVSAPTFTFNPPGTGPTPTPIPGQGGPSIVLVTNKQVVKPGDKVKIQVVLDSDNQEVSSYTIQILFDPTLLKIVDADPLTSELQIDFLDTFFVANLNQASQQTGIINISALSSSGASTITDRNVAEFELEALKNGITEIEISDNSSILSANSQEILEIRSNVDLTIDNSTTNPTTTPVTNTNIPGQTPTTTGPVTTDLPKEIPATALVDDSRLLTVIFGVTLIFIGTLVAKLRRRHETSS